MIGDINREVVKIRGPGKRKIKRKQHLSKLEPTGFGEQLTTDKRS